MSVIQLVAEDLPELGIDLAFLGQSDFHFQPGELEVFATTLTLTTLSVVRAFFQIRFSLGNLKNVPQVLDDKQTPLQENYILGPCLAVCGLLDRKKTAWTELLKTKGLVEIEDSDGEVHIEIKKAGCCSASGGTGIDVNTLARYNHYTSAVNLVSMEERFIAAGITPWSWVGVRSLLLYNCNITDGHVEQLLKILLGPTAIELVNLADNKPGITDALAKQWGDMLRKNATLRNLAWVPAPGTFAFGSFCRAAISWRRVGGCSLRLNSRPLLSFVLWYPGGS